MKKYRLKSVIDNILSGKASEEEKGFFYKFIYLKQNKNLVSDKKLEKRLWRSIQTETFPRRRSVFITPIFRIAASIALLIATSIVVYNLILGDTSTYVSNNKIQNLELPDGSKITLNIESKLSFEEGFGETHRNLKLTGEAFFDVERDESLPFIVSSHGTETKVLGTSFNILSYDSNLTVVTVESGQVNVSRNERSHNLIPNQQARINDDEISLISLDNDNINLAWMDGDLVIPGLPLDMALLRIANFFDRELQIGKISNSCEMRGRFNQNDGIEKILEGLNFTYQDFEFELNETTLKVENIECM